MDNRTDALFIALSVKLKHLDEWTRLRRRNAGLYSQYLQASGVTTPVAIEDVRAVYHLYVIRVEAEVRADLQEFLNLGGFSTGIHYPVALPDLEFYKDADRERGTFQEAFKTAGEILSLPMYPESTEEQI